MDLLPERYPLRSREQSKSKGQFLLGRIICGIYGMQIIILEEFPIPGENLWIDFYLPNNKLAFEYHGKQHDDFNKFFHTDKKGFEKSRARDSRKKAWCELNGITLVEIRKNVSVEELREAIERARIS